MIAKTKWLHKTGTEYFDCNRSNNEQTKNRMDGQNSEVKEPTLVELLN